MVMADLADRYEEIRSGQRVNRIRQAVPAEFSCSHFPGKQNSEKRNKTDQFSLSAYKKEA